MAQKRMEHRAKCQAFGRSRLRPQGFAEPRMNADKNGSFHLPGRIFRTQGESCKILSPSPLSPPAGGGESSCRGVSLFSHLIYNGHDLKESLQQMTMIQKDKTPSLLSEK